MKPLTIEQLKALEVGDWVWVIVLKGDNVNDEHSGRYYHIQPNMGFESTELWCGWLGYGTAFKYSDYGKMWLVYKNKEQAEAKGEIVELPCKVGDTVYAIMEIDYKYKIVEFIANRIVVGEGGNFYFDTPTSYSHRLKFGYSVFADKFEAERRFAEVTGE